MNADSQDHNAVRRSLNGITIRQLPLALEFETTYEIADFLVAPCNHIAATLVCNWPEDISALIIYGPSGCGKTHLLKAWAAAHHAYVLASDDLEHFDLEAFSQHPTPIAVENIELCSSETLLLHLFNLAQQHKVPLLMTSRLAPLAWSFRLPDLRSRLLAVTHCAISEPDDHVMSLLLVKIAADYRLTLPKELIPFIIARIERSFATVHRLMLLIDRISLSTHGRVTLPIVKQALLDL